MDAIVFYAWQSDRPAKINRFLIRDAAKAACDRITEDISNTWSVTLDSDTQGVAGMCDIPNTILNKIESCDIFVADLTFVGRTDESHEPQQLPNANVIFELGYAAKCLGFDVLVGVINEAFGKIEGQVFDIKRRASLVYNMFDDSSAEHRTNECEKLSRQLEEVFRTTLDAVVAQRHGRPVRISGSYSINVHGQKRITFEVTNTAQEPLPPYKVGIVHPKVGSYFIFPSEKSGPLLPHQKRAHSCLVIENGRVPEYFPHFDCDRDGNPLDESDDQGFAFQLVLEDSDKVLYANKRIGRGFVRLIRRTRQHGSEIGGTWADWAELDNSYPDE